MKGNSLRCLCFRLEALSMICRRARILTHIWKAQDQGRPAIFQLDSRIFGKLSPIKSPKSRYPYPGTEQS